MGSAPSHLFFNSGYGTPVIKKLCVSASLREIPILFFDVVNIRVIDIRDADHQHAHLTDRSVDDAGRDVHHGAGADVSLNAVEHDLTLAFEDVVELGGDLVLVQFRTVDIDRVRPGDGFFIALAEQVVAMSTGTALFDRLGLVAEDEIGWLGFSENLIW